MERGHYSMLEGKNAVVTGSTSGIGRAVAEALADAGANVMLNGFGDPSEIETLRGAIAARAGVTVLHHGADMSKPAEIAAMMVAAEGAFGRIDILVNNAGIQHVAAVEAFPPEIWDAIIAVNLTAAFHTIRAVVPGMKTRRWGRIVNIASVHGLVASNEKAAYVAAKHGLVGLTKTVALETAAFGIACNAICPGFVLTRLIADQIEARAAAEGIGREDASLAILRDKQPSLAFIRPEQIGELAVFLCSEAGAAMTGAAIPIDGGWTAR